LKNDTFSNLKKNSKNIFSKVFPDESHVVERNGKPFGARHFSNFEGWKNAWWAPNIFSIKKDGKTLGKCDTPPHSLKDSNLSPKMETMEEGVKVRSLAHSTSRVEGRAGAMRWGLK